MVVWSLTTRLEEIEICKCSKIGKGIEEDGRVRVEVSQTVWRQYAKDLTQDVPHVVTGKIISPAAH